MWGAPLKEVFEPSEQSLGSKGTGNHDEAPVSPKETQGTGSKQDALWGWGWSPLLSVACSGPGEALAV